MAKPNTDSSPNSWIASQNGWVKAGIDVTPNVSFTTLIEVVSTVLGKTLEPTERFDEFPGADQDIDNHDVSVLGLPRSDAVMPDWIPTYHISIFPNYPDDHPEEDWIPRDVSDLLIQALAPLLPDCKLTAS